MARKHIAIASLAAAAVLWGLSVPLSKLSLAWLSPTWLAVVRFGLAAPVLAIASRQTLRDALRPAVVIAGAVGFGGVIMLQNAGVEHTSVSQASVLVGAVPVFVAVATALRGQQSRSIRSWAGIVLAVTGVVLVAGTGIHGASLLGDGLVLASSALSAGFVVVQPRLLDGRDPAAVTAVQLAAGSLISLPVALLWGGAPEATASALSLTATLALAAVGTLLPFWLFAVGQARVPAHVAGPYLNLEPVVGAALGWVAFGDSAGIGQFAGAVAVLGGIVLSTLRTGSTQASVATELAASPSPLKGCSAGRMRPAAGRNMFRPADRHMCRSDPKHLGPLRDRDHVHRDPDHQRGQAEGQARRMRVLRVRSPGPDPSHAAHVGAHPRSPRVR